MSLVKKSAWAVLVVGAVGCAHMPDVKVGYYLPRTSAAVKVQRTIGCDAKDNLVVVDTVTVTTTHAADSTKFVAMDTSRLRGWLTESDLRFEYYDDGRLKAVNATTTGKGEDILKAALSVASSAAAASMTRSEPTRKERCEYIAKSGDGKTLLLNYEAPLTLEMGFQKIPPDARSSEYLKHLGAGLGEVCADLGPPALDVPVVRKPDPDDVVLTLQQPALVPLVIKADEGCSAVRWQGTLMVAQMGRCYELPIPRAAVFGKQQLGASFHESGAMTMVQYVSSPGAGQVLNVLNSALGLSKEIADKQAAELGAEANLIAAQQRLMRCKTDPSKC